MADRVRGPRQRKHWHLLGDVRLNLLSAGTSLLGSFIAAGGEPFTFIRGIGELVVTPDGTGVVANDAGVIAAGVGVVSADAAELGATALPDPGSEPDYPWLWWYQVHMMFPEPSGSYAGLASESARIRIETKAMRRVGPREALVFVVQYVDIAGTPPLDVIGSMRFLVGTS